MKNKVYLLISFYYVSFILSSCCDDNEYYWVEFDKINVTYINDYNVYFLINPEDETIKTMDDHVKDGLLAVFKNFKSVNAFTSCDRWDYYSFEKRIISHEITSDLAFKDSIPPGGKLNDLFHSDFSMNENNFDYQIGSLELQIPDTAYVERELYFMFEFDNGDTIRDTIKNVVLTPVSPAI